ncbi:MAG: hypothetical protein D6695_08795, partial [Planctomycetota bacterium]
DQRLAQIRDELPLRAEHVVELLRPIHSSDQRWDLAQALAAQRPHDADIIANALYAAPLISSADLAARAVDASVLSVCVRLAMGIPDRQADLQSLARRPGGLVRAIQTGVATGRWDELEVLLAFPDDVPELVRMRALGAALHPDRALKLWHDWRHTHEPTAVQLLEAAQLAAAADDQELAFDLLVQAQELDPYEERVYTMLIGGVLSLGATPPPEHVQEALQQLRVHLPDSITAESLAALDVRRQGFEAEAAAQMQRVIERLAAPSEADYSGLLDAWASMQSRGDSEAIQAAERWLTSRLDPDLPEPAAAIAYVRLLGMTSRAEDALTWLDAASLAPTPTVQRERESLWRILGRNAEADASAADRLASERLSISELFELAQVELARHEPIEPVIARLDSVPADIRLNDRQASALLTLASGLQGAILNADDDAERTRLARAFVDVAGFGIDRGLAMSEPIHRLRLRYAVGQAQVSLAELLRMTDQYIADIGRVGDEAFVETYGVLMEASRTQDAIRWAVHVVTSDELLNEQRWAQLLVPLASLASIHTVNQTIERLEERGLLSAAVAAVQAEPTDESHAQADPRAELCYILGGIASARDRRTQAVLLYHRALEYQPDHPWTCNDLGYMLADEGTDLDEAERLLTIALERLPDQTSVIDSFGWLRYKQGRFLDSEAGPGADTLLTRAAESPDGIANPTIQNHLGDVKWMIGQIDRAHDAWFRAERLYLDRIRTFSTPEERRSPMFTELQRRLRNVRDKLAALEIEGEDPPVASTLGERLNPDT